MKKTNKNMKVGISLGMCFGVAIGTTWGESVSGSSGMGLALGLCAGILIGMGLGAIKDNAVNKQLEEQFYIIKDIKNSPETNGFSVLIVNKRGEEQTVIVSKGEMETETFSVGDAVYIDKDGNIEQAYDDEDEDE